MKRVPKANHPSGRRINGSLMGPRVLFQVILPPEFFTTVCTRVWPQT
jgi:hypothetical protein